jgi:hypothetical protein
VPGAAVAQALARKARRAFRLWWLLVVALLAGLVVLGFVFGSDLYAKALLGSAYGARIGCACHYVEGRPLDQCKADFEAGMGMITLSDDPASKSVTGRFPLLASQTASFRPGEGCVLEKWSD